MKRVLIFVMLLWSCGKDDGESNNSTPPDVGTGENAPVVGSTWLVDSESGRWIKPMGAERFLNLTPDGLALWLSIHESREGTFDFMLAVGDEDAQDRCTRTIIMEGLVMEQGGRFRFGPQTFTLPNGLRAEGLILEGQFSEDEQEIGKLSAQGLLALSSIPPSILPTQEGVDLCSILSTLVEAECVPCADGAVDCVDVGMADFVGSAKAANSTIPIAEADCHGDCEASAENMDCE